MLLKFFPKKIFKKGIDKLFVLLYYYIAFDSVLLSNALRARTEKKIFSGKECIGKAEARTHITKT